MSGHQTKKSPLIGQSRSNVGLAMMRMTKNRLFIWLAVLFISLDFLSYELYGKGLVFGNLLTVQMHFNFSVTTPDAPNEPSGKNHG